MASELSWVEGNTSAGSASVHWRRAGGGPAIVFVHGFPLSGETWDKVISRLHERFTCYTLDLIGLGQSRSLADADHSSPGQARALEATLSELGVTACALVGNDTGGWVAREIALLDRQRISHLILTNTEIPHHRPPWIPMYQKLARIPGAGVLFQQLLKSSAFRRSSLGFGGCFHDRAYIESDFFERFIEPLIASRERIDGAMKFLCNMKFARLDEFGQLHGQLTIPTLFVWGADDPTFPESEARAMVGQFPQVVGFYSIAAARLFLYEEHPEEVAQLIEGFVQGG